MENRWPVRKVWAAIISGMVIGGVQTALSIFLPEQSFQVALEQLDVWIQGAVMVAFAYMTPSESKT